MRIPTTLLVRLILSVFLTTAAVCGANGESAGTSSSLPPVPSSANGVTAEQARRTLEVLEDNSKSAQTIEVLRVIGGVQPPARLAAAGRVRRARRLHSRERPGRAASRHPFRAAVALDRAARERPLRA